MREEIDFKTAKNLKSIGFIGVFNGKRSTPMFNYKGEVVFEKGGYEGVYDPKERIGFYLISDYDFVQNWLTENYNVNIKIALTQEKMFEGYLQYFDNNKQFKEVFETYSTTYYKVKKKAVKAAIKLIKEKKLTQI